MPRCPPLLIILTKIRLLIVESAPRGFQRAGINSVDHAMPMSDGSKPETLKLRSKGSGLPKLVTGSRSISSINVLILSRTRASVRNQ